jgi:hypothetical protein
MAFYMFNVQFYESDASHKAPFKSCVTPSREVDQISMCNPFECTQLLKGPANDGLNWIEDY